MEKFIKAPSIKIKSMVMELKLGGMNIFYDDVIEEYIIFILEFQLEINLKL